MSGECEKCGEHFLDCMCGIYQLPPPIKSYSAKIHIPEYDATFQEVSKQMRINVDFLKQEITDHVNKELKRFKDGLLIQGAPPFLTYDDIESVTPPSSTVTTLKEML